MQLYWAGLQKFPTFKGPCVTQLSSRLTKEKLLLQHSRSFMWKALTTVLGGWLMPQQQSRQRVTLKWFNNYNQPTTVFTGKHSPLSGVSWVKKRKSPLNRKWARGLPLAYPLMSKGYRGWTCQALNVSSTWLSFSVVRYNKGKTWHLNPSVSASLISDTWLPPRPLLQG